MVPLTPSLATENRLTQADFLDILVYLVLGSVRAQSMADSGPRRFEKDETSRRLSHHVHLPLGRRIIVCAFGPRAMRNTWENRYVWERITMDFHWRAAIIASASSGIVAGDDVRMCGAR